jgi:hypothetical protein
MSDWTERLSNFSLSTAHDPAQMYEDYATATHDDPGIKGPNGNGIFLRKNGNIDIYSKEGLGITINPDLNSISLYGTKINLYSNETDIYTNPLSWRWNKYPLNMVSTLYGVSAGAGAGAVTVTPGTIMPLPTTLTDSAKYAKKILGMVMEV